MSDVPKVVTDIPGPKAKKIIEESKKYLVTTTRAPWLVIDKMENDLIYDVDGNVYIDLAAGIAVANAGHRNPEIVAAVKDQLEKYIHSAPHDFYDTLQYKVAKKLTEITPGAFDKKVFFGNSGTEANEAAIKIAKLAKKRQKLIAFIGSFHGRSHGSLGLTASKPIHRKGFLTIPEVIHVPYANPYRCPFNMDPEECGLFFAQYIENYIFAHLASPEEVAAIFVEPIAGEGGYVVPPKSFIREIRRITKDYDIVMVDDEVQAGFCRTGKWFAIEHFGVEPDIISLAKAIADGLPLSATVIRAELDFKESGSHSSTFGGNALSLAAALKNIEFLEANKICERVTKLGNEVMAKLRDAMENSKIIGDVRGLGFMIGVEIVKDKETKEMAPKIRDKIVELALKRGLVMLPAGKSAIRVAPPLTIEEEHLMKGLDIFIGAIKDVERGAI
ncbi:MAG: acetyl ornithine aminotransferase family protein [Candidatus Njordarchaeia archaeon]